MKQFLAKKCISTLEHPTYFPDLTLCDFFLFPKIKCVLKGTHFESLDTVKKKSADVLQQLPESDLLQSKQDYQCLSANGYYIEDDMR